MAHRSAIEWTDATWNPWHGCHKVSAGCKNCYMFRDKKRYGQDPNVVQRAADKTFYAPLKWTEPKKIFTCSWSDFFIEEAAPWRDEAFAIMALTPQHTYQVLTKRPDRMYEYLRDPGTWTRLVYVVSNYLLNKLPPKRDRIFHSENFRLPLPNVWLGVSAEDQKTADKRIPDLLNTPAAVRFLSMEPLLGPVRLDQFPVCDGVWANFLTGRDYIDDGREVVHQGVPVQHNKIDWVIGGGESGPNARPTHPDWIRSIRDQATAAGVAFHFKQWGEWVDPNQISALGNVRSPQYHEFDDGLRMFRMGKKGSGRRLDGREWNEMPNAQENMNAARA